MTTVNGHPTEHPTDFINRLPFDALSMVFTEVMRDVPPDGYYRQLIPLCMVCKNWNRVVNQTAQLWSVISVKSPRSIIASKALKASGNLPLVVNVKFTAGDNLHNRTKGNSEKDIREIILNQTPRRWKRASFHIGINKDHWLFEIESALRYATFLQQLSLTQSGSTRSHWQQIYRSPLNINSTSLLYYTSDLALPSSPAAGLSQLLSLQLIGRFDALKITSADWLKVLAASPNLMEMELNSDTDLLEDDVVGLQQEVSLPSLETLILHSKIRLATLILGSISIPSCKTLDVEMDSKLRGDPSEDTFCQVLGPQVAVVARHIVQESQYTVDVATAPNSLSLWPSNPSDDYQGCLIVHLSGDWQGWDDGPAQDPLSMLQAVLNDNGTDPHLGHITISLLMKDPVSSTELEDDWEMFAMSPMSWFDAVSTCVAEWPSIQSIRCHMNVYLLESFLKQLSTPSLSGRFCCPTLSELIIDRDPWALNLNPWRNGLFSGSRYWAEKPHLNYWVRGNSDDWRAVRYDLENPENLWPEGDGLDTQPSFDEVLESIRPALTLQPA